MQHQSLPITKKPILSPIGNHIAFLRHWSCFKESLLVSRNVYKLRLHILFTSCVNGALINNNHAEG